MKQVLVAVIGAATFVAGAPLGAQSNVTTRYANWEHRLRDRVNDLLYYPQAANGATGDVLVGFQIGADGLPTNVAVQKSSGVQDLDRAAFQLVSRLGRIGAVPSANGDARDLVFRLSYRDGASTIASMQLGKPVNIASEKRDQLIASTGEGQPHR